jgi:hypothetical protein
MSKYRTKHRLKDNGKLVKQVLTKNGSYYKRYYVKQVERFKLYSSDTEIVDVYFVKDEDLLGKEVNCTEGMIADILD